MKRKLIARIIISLVAIISFVVKSGAQDSTFTEEKIAKWLENFRKSNKTRLYEFRTKDSTVVFGTNKAKTYLTSALIFDRRRNVNKWYYYHEKGVFRISVLQINRRSSRRTRKEFCDYYFEGNKIIRQNGVCYFKPEDLLIEANRLKVLATSYLGN